MEKAVIFARVSSANGTQDYERQIKDLQTVADQNNWKVEAVFTEKVSGVKKNSERIAISQMIDYINNHYIDKVLITELSRLGRDTFQVLQIIETLTNKKVSVYIQNHNIETLTSNKEINTISQFLVTILSEVAGMERKIIKERVQSGYQNFRSQGGIVGRKKGYRKSNESMKKQYKEEIKLLHKNISYRNIQKITGTSINTLRKLVNIK